MRLRARWCGWGRGISLIRSPSTTCLWCHHLSVSLTLHMTLGVIIDSQLTMTAHVLSFSHVSFFQVQQLRLVAWLLSAEAVKSLFLAFICCRLYYCNAMFYDIGDTLFKLLRCLQSIYNAAASLFTGARQRNHILPVLKQLHWLPLWRRVKYWYSSRWEVKPCCTFRSNASSSPSTLSSSFCQHQQLHHSKDQYSVGRQKFFYCWTTSLEQSTKHSATAWHGVWIVQMTTEDIFVCLKLQHTCDSLFFDALCINSFSYLFTYVDNIWAIVIVWRIRRKTIRTVLCCVL